MNVVVIGCGRTGSALSNILSLQGHSVVVIDISEERFSNLNVQFSGITILGSGTDLNTLKEANTHNADIFVVTTGDDNVNLVSAQIAKKIFNVHRVLVRVEDIQKIDIYCHYELEVASATNLLAEHLAEMIKTPQQIKIISSIGGVDIVRFKVPTLEAAEGLSQLIKTGSFHSYIVLTNGKAITNNLGNDIFPDSEVIGAVSKGKVGHLVRVLEISEKFRNL
jgi:trk system potassium uptake protein TrkA